MRFDPEYIIELCKNSGVELRREGPFLCYRHGRKRIAFESDLIDLLRIHKDELMPFLPDTSPQVDLFDPY